jgi:broad specificity phosphatase PhoE
VPTWSFLRHGQSEANAAGWLAGFLDSPLTAEGIRQAERARPAVASLPLDLVLTSDLSRAVLTADIVLAERSVSRISTPALRERHAGEFEEQPVQKLRASGELALLSEWNTRPPGGESLADVARRTVHCLAEHDRAHEVLVVAHGALIRALIHAVDQLAVGPLGEWRPQNCELVVRKLPVGFWRELGPRLFP